MQVASAKPRDDLEFCPALRLGRIGLEGDGNGRPGQPDPDGSVAADWAFAFDPKTLVGPHRICTPTQRGRASH